MFFLIALMNEERLLMNELVQLPRRTFLFYSLAAAGLLTTEVARSISPTELLISNVTGLYTVNVARVVRPTNVKDVVEAVRSWPGSVAIGGGRFSMGGQIGIHGGLHIDMRSLKALIWFKPETYAVRVQAGMTWRDLQDLIDPHNLSVKTMQSFSNFSIGGAVSVNAHGRYVGNGPVGNSVRSLQMVLADGSLIEANRQQNTELFQSALGGYGAIGVITEVELELVENVRMERIVKSIPLKEYPNFFKQSIESDHENLMHNADLRPPLFDAPVSVTWRATTKPLTEISRLVPRDQSYSLEKNMIWALTELPFAENLRKNVVDPMLLDKPMVTWRNHEASLDVAQLEPRTRSISTFVLQEYFIPIRNFLPFAKAMAKVLQTHRVEVLNVSIRHSSQDKISMLPWAKEDVFSFVLYYKQRTYSNAMEKTGMWTREMIELALINEGRYYLPYQLHATKKQFDRAYPEAAQLRNIKKTVDPKNKFSNEMWTKYL